MPNWGGGLQGAAGGALAGAALGPIGAGVGGALGGLMGLFGGGSADDAQQRAQAQLSESGYGGTINQAGQQAQGNLGQQQAFIDQLRGQMNGTGGPSVAQNMLAQQTQANQAASASAIGSQRGLNPALAARMILDQQAGQNQQAAGQGALLRAQEQTTLRGQMGAALGQQGAQAQGLMGTAGGLQNSQNQARIANAQGGAAAYANQQGQNNAAMGGLLGGMGAAAAHFAPGAGQAWNPQNASSPGAPASQNFGNSVAEQYAHGGQIPGMAHGGDSTANDTVATRLSPGEIVIPRSIALSPEAPDAAAAFIRAIRHQHTEGQGYADGGMVVPTGAFSADPFARAAPDLQGFAGPPPPDALPMQAPWAAPQTVPDVGAMPDAMARPPEADAGLARLLSGGGAGLKVTPPAPDAPAPSPVAPVGSPAPTGSGSDVFAKAQAREQAAVAEQGRVASERAASEAHVAEAQAASMAELQKNNADVLQKRIANSQRLFSDYASSKLDPNHYFASMDTAGKVSSAIGLILGGLGAGLSHGPNLALGVIDKAIDRDLEVQKLEMGKKANALSHYLQETGDIRQAMVLAKADARDVAAAQMTAATMKFGGPAAAAQSQALIAGLQKQGVIDRSTVQNTLMDTQMTRMQMAATQWQMERKREVWGDMAKGDTGEVSPAEKALRLGFLDKPEDQAAHTVNVPTSSSRTTSKGDTVTETSTTPRIALDKEAAAKAREAFLSTGMIRDKLAVLKELAAKGRGLTAFSPEDQRRAAAAVSGLKESYERGFNLVNAQPSEKTIEAANEIVKDPTKWLQTPGNITGSLKYMEDDLDGVEEKAKRAYLFPRKGDAKRKGL